MLDFCVRRKRKDKYPLRCSLRDEKGVRNLLCLTTLTKCIDEMRGGGWKMTENDGK